MAGPLLEPITGPGGVRLLRLHGPGGASADISEYGAHVVSWVDAGGHERLFLSPNAVFGGGQSIRGGVPVVFPQFAGRGALPKHGFARIQNWLADTGDTFADGRTGLRLTLVATPATRALWPHEFEATLDVRLGARSLEVVLGIVNRDDRPFGFTAALHSYLAVDELAEATLSGLAGRPFEDAAGGGWRVQSEPMVRFGSEIDRVYPEIDTPLELSGAHGRLRIEATGFRDVVVWNPGPLLAAGLADLGPGQHQGFVCVEAAAVLKPVVLAPGQAWSGRQQLGE